VKPFFLFRLVLDGVAVVLLLTALAYFWFDNATHEIIGTTMFALLIGHNIFNRWYGTIARKRSEARGTITRAINLSLLAVMLGLLVTSVIISQTVFSALPLTSTFTVRQLHTMAAYLALLVVAVHLGLHWKMFMAAARSVLGITTTSKARTLLLRMLALAGSTYGLISFWAADVSQKLLMQMSFDFGGLQTSPTIFLLQHTSIVCLGASLGHYGPRLIQKRKPA
jgi:hypothetical protein